MQLRRTVLLAVVFVSSLAALIRAQPGGGPSDTVIYRDRAKDGELTTKIGEARETPAGIVVTSTGKSVTVSPADVVAVYFGRMPGVDDKTRQEMPGWDAKGGAEALTRYGDVLKNATGLDDRTKRFLEFKLAMAAAKVADAKSGEEFKTAAAAAIDKLNTVARSYTKSWEVWPAFRTAARLQSELGKHKEAAATLANLAKSEGIPPELRTEAKLAEADALFRGGALLDAGPVLGDVAKLKLTNTQKERLAIFQAVLKGAQEKTDVAKVHAAAKAVHDQIDKSNDAAARAAAHNALGEMYLMANLPRDAMWEFLWVEAVHNQDRDEVVKALDRLAEIFDKQGDKDRAAVYREKVLKAKGA